MNSFIYGYKVKYCIYDSDGTSYYNNQGIVIADSYSVAVGQIAETYEDSYTEIEEIFVEQLAWTDMGVFEDGDTDFNKLIEFITGIEGGTANVSTD